MKKYSIPLLTGIFVVLGAVLTLVISNNNQQTTIRSNAQLATPTTTVLAKNLEVPWALGFLPDGNILFTERTGKIKLLNRTTSAVTAITTISDVKAQAESGLLGLAVHPQYSTNNFIYIYYSYNGSGGTQNRVVRYVFANNQLSSPQTIIDGIPGNDYHNGGRMRFGPDGYLYIGTGDGNNLATPQDTNSLGGKILRVQDNGEAAPGNPFNNRVWSYGHRNPQGLAWDGTTMYATEHGPSQPSCCDEVNKIVSGGNYGWPDVKGDETKAGTIKNLVNSGQDSNNTWAPSGTTFYNGSVLFAGLRGQALYEAKVQGETASIVNQHFKDQLGRIRDVVIGPDNAIYIATSNKSAQGGSAQPEDDKILRVTFPGVPNISPTTEPVGVTPTIYCVGGVGAPPCAPIDPSNPATTPGSGGTNPTVPPVGGVNPTSGSSNPNPTIEPCTTSGSNSIMHNKKKKKMRGGFIEQFIRFIMWLIQYFLGGFNGGQIPNPTPNPDPVSPTPCPEPTDVQPPTNAPEPSSGTEPTTPASVAPTQTSQQPSGAIYLGAAIDPNSLDNAAYAGALKQYKFTSLTAENAMKFAATEPNRGQFNFAGGDKIVAFAQENGMRVRGHTLVWHDTREIPGWVNGLSNAEAEAALKNHIQTMVSRYKGKVQQWDVVNEAFEDSGVLRNSVWKQKVGDDYIAKAFQWAREADPNAQLYYNEFSAESGENGAKAAKSDAVFNMVKDLKARGVPIDGVGMQTHSSGPYPGSGAAIEANMKRLGTLGVKVEITELDVKDVGDENAKAQRYAELGTACKNAGNCTGVTTWGLYDGATWLSGTDPLLLDSNFQAKPSYSALRNALGLQ